MSPLPLLAQQSRLARGSFVLAAITVYVLSLASQTLLSAPVVAQVGVAPFVLVQIALIWVWIVLHMRRLRDAGRPNGLVIGVALIYALEVVLLTLLVWILESQHRDQRFRRQHGRRLSPVCHPLPVWRDHR